MGVECDGANYRRAKTARDRDKLREGILRDLGWSLHRIWSTDWWTDPEREIRKLEAALVRMESQTAAHGWPEPKGGEAMKQTRGRVGGLRDWVERVEYEPLHGEELRRRVEGPEADLVEVDELRDGIEERHEGGLVCARCFDCWRRIVGLINENAEGILARTLRATTGPLRR